MVISFKESKLFERMKGVVLILVLVGMALLVGVHGELPDTVNIKREDGCFGAYLDCKNEPNADLEACYQDFLACKNS